MAKIFNYICISIFCFGIGILASGLYYKGRIDNLDGQYRSTLDEYRVSIDNLSKHNSELEDSISRSEREREEKYARAKKLIGSAEEGLSGAINSTQRIRIYTQRIREIIEIVFAERKNISD